MLGIIFLLATFLSIYHVGIEQGIISESALCKSQSGLNILDKEQLLQELEKSNISCKNVTFTILGFSLATINTFVSLFFKSQDLCGVCDESGGKFLFRVKSAKATVIFKNLNFDLFCI